MSRSVRFAAGSKKRLTLLGVVAVALAASVGAGAYFTSDGSGTATASTGVLGAPTISSVTRGAGTVAISWSAVGAPAADAVAYYVTRDGSEVAGDCPSAGSQTTVTSCVDGGLSAGTYVYSVTAVWRSWSQTSAGTSVTLVSGRATQISLAGATTDLAAGTSRLLTATVEDVDGNTVADGSDSSAGIVFAKTGSGSGTVSGLGSTTASNGIATATVTGDLAGPIDLRASATLIQGGTSSNTLSFNVVHGPGAQIILSGSSSPLKAGVTRQFTATIKDAHGNTIVDGTDSTDSISFANAGGTGSVSGFGSNAAVAGVATETVTGQHSGSVIVQASGTVNGTSRVSNTIGFDVTPASASELVVAGYPASTVAGVSHSLTVTARDSFGNVDTNYAGTVHFSNTNDAAAVLPADSTLSAGVGSFSATFETVVGGSKTLTATDTATSSITGSEPGITVTPGSAAKVAVSATPGSATASAATNISLALQLQDQFGNSTVSSGTTTLALSTASARGFFAATAAGSGTLGGTINATFANGVGAATEFYGDETASASTTITAKNGAATWGTTSVAITSGAAVGIIPTSTTTSPTPGLTCTGSVGSLTCSSLGEANGSNTITTKISLADQFKNVVTNTTGTPIGIDLASTGDGNLSPTGPNALSVPNNASETSGSFTATRNNGNNKTITITATIHGVTETLTITMSS